MKIRVIACEAFARELSFAAAQSGHIIDTVFPPFGLHDLPNDLRDRLQFEIDSADSGGYDYIVFGYGLCSRGTAGLVARNIPLLIPRAHDCITLFLGSRARYDSEFAEHPGTYYYSPGWIERKDGEVSQGFISDRKERCYEERFQEYAAKYGEDNARFLMEQESQWLVNYNRAVFINMGIGPLESYRRFVQGIATSRGWEYEEIRGDMSLIQRLAEGDWSDDDFLVVRPGERVVETFDAQIIRAERVRPEPVRR